MVMSHKTKVTGSMVKGLNRRSAKGASGTREIMVDFLLLAERITNGRNAIAPVWVRLQPLIFGDKPQANSLE